MTDVGTWTCRKCRTTNAAARVACTHCGKRRARKKVAFADQPVWIQLFALACGLALVIAVIVGMIMDARNPPIRKQNCSQLAATYAQIVKDADLSNDFDTRSKAAQDAQDLNDRVDALGGCPEEPSLQ